MRIVPDRLRFESEMRDLGVGSQAPRADGLWDGFDREASIDKLSNLVLFARHPRLMGRRIKSSELGLKREWKRIREGLNKRSSAGKATGFVINLALPSQNPAPDFSQTQDQLGAWEKARFEGLFRFKVSTEITTIKKGKSGSYVSLLEVDFNIPQFKVLIARHLRDNSTDTAKQRQERIQWLQILSLIRKHAFVHLDLFRAAAQNLEEIFKELFHQFPFPTVKKPWAISKDDLDTYMQSVGEFLGAVVKLKFWEKTCEWEKKDYPQLTRDLSSLSVFLPLGLQVNCDPQPKLPDIPLPSVPK